MYSKRQLSTISSIRKPRIAHINATGSIARKLDNIACNKMFYYCVVCKINESVIPTIEMLTFEHDTGSISKALIDFIIVSSEMHAWSFFKVIAVD